MTPGWSGARCRHGGPVRALAFRQVGPSFSQPAVAAAFVAVFGVFVVALLVLAVAVVTWAVRRDRQGRQQWRQRQLDAQRAAERGVAPGPHRAAPDPDASGRNGAEGGSAAGASGR